MGAEFTGESWLAGVGLPPAPSPIVEAECRRPYIWSQGQAVPLAGGLVLHLPRLDGPHLRPCATMRVVGPELPGKMAAWDDALAVLTDAVERKGQPGAPDIVDSFNAVDFAFLDWLGDATTIAAGLLAWNYDLSAFDVAGLFPLDVEEQGETARALKAALGAEFQAWLSAHPEEPDESEGWASSPLADEPPPPIIENARRRQCWTAGPGVSLAAGHGWRLPVLDLATLATVPDLRAEMMESMQLAVAAGQARRDGKPEDTRYLVKLADIARRLIAANYDLDADELDRLFPGPWSDGFVDLLASVAPALGATLAPTRGDSWGFGLMYTIPAPGRSLSIN